jgi:hypothetical protein
VVKFSHGSKGNSAFFSDDDVFTVVAFFFSDFFGGSGHVGVEGTAKTSIGAADEDNVLTFGGWSVLVKGGNGTGTSFSETSDGWKLFGSLGVFSGGNHIHGFGNFFDIVNRFDSDTELLEFTGTVSNRLSTSEGGGNL